MEKVKAVISDENIEILRDSCLEKRDLAMEDLLLSTGIRGEELVNLNIADINFTTRECIVYGKGDKERRAYFDAKSKVHVEEYLQTRKDENPALFVSLKAPYNRVLGVSESGYYCSLRKPDKPKRREFFWSR